MGQVGNPATSTGPARPSSCRILFNCDGYSVFSQANAHLEMWIQNIYTGLEKSHVSSLFSPASFVRSARIWT